MKQETMQKKLIQCFCKEYQSVWLIDLSNLSLQIYAADENADVRKNINGVKDYHSCYDQARKWYIENCVMASQRARLMEQTTIDNILRMTADNKAFFIEYTRVSNGEYNFNQLVYDRISDEDEQAAYLLMGFRDIDIRKKADIDDVTGLYNRRAFFTRAENMIRQHPEWKIDIVISDILDFKKINEVYGIRTADKILHWLGKYLASKACEDILVGRYGGDQMVMLGQHEKMESLFVKEANDVFKKQKAENGLPDFVLKYGIYHDIPHDRSVVSCCDKAHMALNNIKAKYAQEFAFYDSSMESRLEKQRQIEDSMYQSLADGDFKVFYQPKHDALTGSLVGAEALVRWIHPKYGFMSPMDFIPLFEQNGFIVENDRFVWRRTCENLRRWREKGIKTIPISVNASKLTISECDLISDMQLSVESNGLTPNQLHVEITESLMTADINDLVAKLQAIRDAGFGVELDDFGSGYSSMNVLSVLPLDIVKLDMSFMQHFGDEKRTKVLGACITLAKELGFKTVSEGVEYHEQEQVLGDLGVDMIQGYLYSKPLPEEEFEQYLMKFA